MSSISQSKLKLKTFKYKEDHKINRKVFIEPVVLPEVIERDFSTVSHNKKVGGQFNQYYFLKKDELKPLSTLVVTPPINLPGGRVPIDYEDSFGFGVSKLVSIYYVATRLPM